MTAIFSAGYLAPIPSPLFELHLERVSWIGVPVFVVFREFAGVFDLLPLPYAIQQILICMLLVLLALCWFTFVLLPFWSDYRLRGCSPGRTRILFALFGIAVTIVCWIGLGLGRVHDA